MIILRKKFLRYNFSSYYLLSLKDNYYIVSKSFIILSFNNLFFIKKFILYKISEKIFIFSRLNFFIPFTKQSIGSRMGKGKGKIFFLGTILRPGTILFEIYFSIVY